MASAEIQPSSCPTAGNAHTQCVGVLGPLSLPIPLGTPFLLLRPPEAAPTEEKKMMLCPLFAFRAGSFSRVSPPSRG